MCYYDWDDYMKTLLRRSLATEVIEIAWIVRVLSERLIAERGDRELLF